VKDQGIGISPEKLPSLLRPFTRGTDSMEYNYEGIGLDLYSDKVIVDKLGGKISITSQLNKGTTVNVSIPINRAAQKGSSAIAVNTA
jgi:signal transduction histidine kinase